MTKPLEDQVHDVLPQTQCQMCGYDDCRAYSKAIVEKKESIHLCAPGGEWVSERLAALCDRDAAAVKTLVQRNYRHPKTMEIRQDECIGCTKCIQACPVDAVIGTGKLRHDILTDLCNGCELCLPACPVDCIDSVPSFEAPWNFQQRHQAQGLGRYALKQSRMKIEEDQG